MQVLKNIVRIFILALKMLYNVFIISPLYHFPFLKNQIKTIEERFGESLPKAYHKRFRLYVIIATIFITWIETLRNQRLLQAQKQVALLFCGLTPLFDDLFDDFEFSDTEITLLSQKKIQRGLLQEKICIALFEAIEHRNGSSNWSDLWQKVLDYQIASKAQQGNTLHHSDIQDITFGKGGYALLLYLEAILPKAYSHAEGEAVFQMGAIIQLTNDIFDIYKDREAGVRTMVTMTTDMHEFRRFYDHEVSKNIAQFRQLPYPKANIEDFIFQYKLLVSRGWVALDQLQSLQRNEADALFHLRHYSRKQLICDMELWQNIKQSFRYSLT
jgi:hypothetical protein